MFYVYILMCNDKKLYAGYTKDLKQRMIKHQSAQVLSTKTRLPCKLLFYKAYTNKYDALRREKYLKTKGKQTLRAMLRETLTS